MAIDSKVKGDAITDLLKGRSIEDREQGKKMIIPASEGVSAVVVGIPEIWLNFPGLN